MSFDTPTSGQTVVLARPYVALGREVSRLAYPMLGQLIRSSIREVSNYVSSNDRSVVPTEHVATQNARWISIAPILQAFQEATGHILTLEQIYNLALAIVQGGAAGVAAGGIQIVAKMGAMAFSWVCVKFGDLMASNNLSPRPGWAEIRNVQFAFGCPVINFGSITTPINTNVGRGQVQAADDGHNDTTDDDGVPTQKVVGHWRQSTWVGSYIRRVASRRGGRGGRGGRGQN